MSGLMLAALSVALVAQAHVVIFLSCASHYLSGRKSRPWYVRYFEWTQDSVERVMRRRS